ncbi:MAG: VWA domain-containing protein, partial [Thermoanaerobaculia bacterium]|nr:VWA domain-containing protein [Thermoanaerobaculia bacterium]
LRREHRRRAFIERFWSERDPFPETRPNEFRELWEARRAAVAERFGGPVDERGRAFLLAGEPASIEMEPCPAWLPSMEIWRYRGGREAAPAFHLVFVDAPGGRRLWARPDSLADLVAWPRRQPLAGEADLERELRTRCADGGRLVADLATAASWDELDRLALLPRPSTEWVATFLARSTELPEGAETFRATLDVDYPARHQSRTVVQGLVTVPVEECRAEGSGPATVCRFVLDGELLRDGELFDDFRYRFELPAAEAAGGRVPLVIQRYLRPGEYDLAIRVHELASDRYHRVERRLEVPVAPGVRIASTPVVAPPAPPVPAPAAQGEAGLAPLLAEANSTLETEEHRLLLRVPERGLLTGRVRVTASVSSEAIAKVAFSLNGRPVMTKARPPFSVELDLGRAPRLHRLMAVGVDAEGRELTRDRLLLNVGPQRFAVRLLEPRPGRYRYSLRARAEVDLPRGARLDRLEIYLDETRVATLYQPPFTQPILLPEGDAIAYVRAVAYLEDGNSAEDLVYVNAPQNLDSVQIDFVELYTSVVDRKGRPVEGLTAESFEVIEDGSPQRLARFDRVRDLPIHAGLVVDASTSMTEELDQAEKAALSFFQRVIRPKDRAAVFRFSDQPELHVPLTNNLEALAGGLAGLEAEGETALWDAVVFATYYLAGIRGKRALVLLTDGEDSISRNSFAEALEFARRAGVAVYSIGLALGGSRDFEVRNLLRRLARETGGESFFIDRAAQLDSIYERIEEELRTQYLLGYQSSQTSSDAYREVEVRVREPGLTAKTIPGYYP